MWYNISVPENETFCKKTSIQLFYSFNVQLQPSGEWNVFHSYYAPIITEFYCKTTCNYLEIDLVHKVWLCSSMFASKLWLALCKDYALVILKWIDDIFSSSPGIGIANGLENLAVPISTYPITEKRRWTLAFLFQNSWHHYLPSVCIF